MKEGAKKAVARLGGVAVAAGSATCAFPTLAFASEESSGINAILPDPVEFVPMLIAFIILWIILAKFGWPMFEGMLDKREKTIKEALEKSEAARAERVRVILDYQKQLAHAPAHSPQLGAVAKKTAAPVKADITAKAQAEAAAMVDKARDAIEAEKKAAIAELQGSVADLSISVAGRLIGEDLNDDQHRKIIERYATEAGSFNAN